MSTIAGRVAPLELKYKPDAAEAQERVRAFWQREVLDRPCVCIRVPKEGVDPPSVPQVLAADGDYAGAVALFEEWASGTCFLGEAFPVLSPCWGPDQFAAFIGADLILAPETNTSWAVPFVEDWDEVEPFSIRPDNRWWSMTLDFYTAAARLADGKFLMGHLDIHSNLDCLAAVRGPERLCMDLIEHPDEVLRAAGWMDSLYKPVYNAVYEAGGMAEQGTVTWLGLWSDGRTHVPSCDFCYMISPEHFRRFVMPSLEYEVSCLDTAIYHMDGVGQLPHLDDILAIPGLHGVQWVPGVGERRMPEWIDLLRKIQRAGKSVQIGLYPDELKAVHSKLDPRKTFYEVGCGTEAEARELLGWLVDHT